MSTVTHAMQKSNAQYRHWEAKEEEERQWGFLPSQELQTENVHYLHTEGHHFSRL